MLLSTTSQSFAHQGDVIADEVASLFPPSNGVVQPAAGGLRFVDLLRMESEGNADPSDSEGEASSQAGQQSNSETPANQALDRPARARALTGIEWMAWTPSALLEPINFAPIPPAMTPMDRTGSGTELEPQTTGEFENGTSAAPPVAAGASALVAAVQTEEQGDAVPASQEPSERTADDQEAAAPNPVSAEWEPGESSNPALVVGPPPPGPDLPSLPGQAPQVPAFQPPLAAPHLGPAPPEPPVTQRKGDRPIPAGELVRPGKPEGAVSLELRPGGALRSGSSAGLADRQPAITPVTGPAADECHKVFGVRLAGVREGKSPLKETEQEAMAPDENFPAPQEIAPAAGNESDVGTKLPGPEALNSEPIHRVALVGAAPPGAVAPVHAAPGAIWWIPTASDPVETAAQGTVWTKLDEGTIDQQPTPASGSLAAVTSIELRPAGGDRVSVQVVEASGGMEIRVSTKDIEAKQNLLGGLNELTGRVRELSLGTVFESPAKDPNHGRRQATQQERDGRRQRNRRQEAELAPLAAAGLSASGRS